MRRKYRSCTSETTGTVLQRKYTGHDLTVITVRYTVGSETFTLKESLKYGPVTAIRAGGLPIGTQSTAKLGAVKAGDPVRVCYDPMKPKTAYLPGNTGHRTS